MLFKNKVRSAQKDAVAYIDLFQATTVLTGINLLSFPVIFPVFNNSQVLENDNIFVACARLSVRGDDRKAGEREQVKNGGSLGRIEGERACKNCFIPPFFACPLFGSSPRTECLAQANIFRSLLSVVVLLQQELASQGVLRYISDGDVQMRQNC